MQLPLLSNKVGKRSGTMTLVTTSSLSLHLSLCLCFSILFVYLSLYLFHKCTLAHISSSACFIFFFHSQNYSLLIFMFHLFRLLRVFLYILYFLSLFILCLSYSIISLQQQIKALERIKETRKKVL